MGDQSRPAACPPLRVPPVYKSQEGVSLTKLTTVVARRGQWLQVLVEWIQDRPSLRHRNSVERSSFPCRRHRGTNPARDHVRCNGGRRDAVQQRARATFEVWHDLLLVPAGALWLGDLSLDHAMVGELPPVHSRGHRVRLRVVRSLGASATLAPMGAAAHHWNGPVLRRHVGCLPRRQWKQLPIWKDLPPFTYWLVPVAVAAPIILALLWDPFVSPMKQDERTFT